MKRIYGILIILFLLHVSVNAQEKNSKLDSVVTDEIIVNANRVKTSKLLAPNKIQVMDDKFINAVNGSRLSDVLSLSDAVFIKDYGFNSGLKTISLNATQSEQTLIMVDGIKLNGLDNSQYDIGLLQLDDVTRIEISNGGSSALYGSEAIGGVVNIITKKNNPDKPFGYEIKGTYGSYGMNRVFIKTSQQFMKNNRDFIDYDVSFSNESAKNNYDYYYFDGLVSTLKQRENNDYVNHFLNFNFKVKFDNSTELKAAASYNYWDRNVPGIDLGYSPGTAKQIDRDGISEIIFTKNFSKYFSLKTDFDYKYSLRSYFDTATFNLSTKINSFYKLNSFIHNSAFSYVPSKKTEFDFGYELNYNNIHSDQTSEGNLTQGSLYTAGKYQIENVVASAITFYPSLRYDYYSNISDRNVITGKFGLNIKPFKKADFSLKSSIGNNFRAPGFDDIYWKDLGNPNLKPEKSVSFDGGIFYSFKFILKNEIEFSYFNIITTDRIVWTPGSDNIWRPVNIGKVNSNGIDASLKSISNLSKRISVVFNFNYNFANSVKKNEDYPGDPFYNKQMLYIPKEFFKSSFMLNYLTSSKIIKFVSLNGFYTYSGIRYMNPENTVFVPYYQLLDANLGLSFNTGKFDTEIKLAVNNIFNQNYQVISGYPMPLRNYKLQISFKY